MTSAAQDRVLVLVRHAKAEEGQGKPDHDRRLTKRGRSDAAAAGRWLAEQGLGCDLVLCSTSARTQETCAEMAKAGCAESEVQRDRAIYNAPPERILEAVREADHDASVVMVIGHAPGIPSLASMLAEGEGSQQAHEAMGAGFPTAGIAVLRYAGPWADLERGTARLERFHVSRG